MKKRSKLNNLLFCVIIVYICFVFGKQQITIKNIKSQIDEKNLEVEKLKEKNKTLQEEVDMSKSDSYIEKLAREKLNLIKPGENAVINNTDK
ncbi:septum formation initiator family protein [Clostridium malenominatum]|uniref:Septum formation initiator family protein n=1 Tax=Clostridium malenominatum TaxID=1539 RepID=A0ABP3U960_9CLOT